MSETRFQTRQCVGASCRFRFPVVAKSDLGAACPRCGGLTTFAGDPYDSREVRAEAIPREGMGRGTNQPFEVEALLDNIRSIYNVGSIFRTADGAGIRHLHLCGITATPEQPKVVKTALGAEQAVAWSYYPNALDAALLLKKEGKRLWALEGGPQAGSLFDGLPELQDDCPIVIIVGNELAGVDPAILEVCDQIFYLPMAGVKGSLNAAVSFGIMAYFVTRWRKVKSET